MAALHFNENTNRKQAQTKGGEDRYDIIFPKYKKGGYVVRKVVQNPTYGKLFNAPDYIVGVKHIAFLLLTKLFLLQCSGYVEELLTETTSLCAGDKPTLPPTLSTPQPLSSGYDRPEKVTAVVKHKSRFSIQ